MSQQSSDPQIVPSSGSSMAPAPTVRDIREYAVSDAELDSMSRSLWDTSIHFGLASLFVGAAIAELVELWSRDWALFVILLCAAIAMTLLGALAGRRTKSQVQQIRESAQPVSNLPSPKQ